MGIEDLADAGWVDRKIAVAIPNGIAHPRPKLGDVVANIVDKIGTVDPDTSILLLGSGFSLGATNIGGGSPPNGAGLRRHFIDQLGLPSDTTYDLQVLTEEFAENDAQKLRDELYHIFRISAVDDFQRQILSKTWRRIYTTNYDDVVEFYRHETKSSPNAFDVSERLPSKLPPGAVVHLHGSIRSVNADNVLSNIVLGESSYVKQYLEKSPWYDQLQRDLTFASAFYIIGYSLADYHISALLLEDPEIARRTTFIQGPDVDKVLLRRTANYGRTLFIGTSGFAEALKTAPKPPPVTLNSLRSFRPLDPQRDKRASAKPTAPEVYDLLVYGDFDPARLARSQPGESYAIARAGAVRHAADAVERKASLIVDGRLGNGKTIFLHLLASELTIRKWTCFLFRPGQTDIANEIATLREVERLVIFIEQYSAAQDSMKGLRAALPEAKFVVEVRTGTFEVRYHELTDLLPSPFDRISLNTLTRDETAAFGALCVGAGLPVPKGATGTNDLRDLLLALFENKAIRERIEKALAPLFQSRAMRRILAMTMIMSTHQSAVGAGFIRSVVGEDPFVALKSMEALSKEIFDLSADSFRARSAVFSDFVVKTFLQPDDIADAVVDVTLAAASRRTQRSYRVLMSNMMAYTSLRKTLIGKGDVDQLIIAIYERMRHDDRVNSEPLFWLQFAIVMAELPKLGPAKEYIRTAYDRAEVLDGFQTYQIDTQALRIALLVATDEAAGQAIGNIEDILEGLERVDGMLTESSHRSFAVRVLDGVHPFVAKRLGDMSSGERTAIQFWVLKVAKSLAELPDDFKSTSNSEATRKKVDAAAALFLKS